MGTNLGTPDFWVSLNAEQSATERALSLTSHAFLTTELQYVPAIFFYPGFFSPQLSEQFILYIVNICLSLINYFLNNVKSCVLFSYFLISVYFPVIRPPVAMGICF